MSKYLDLNNNLILELSTPDNKIIPILKDLPWWVFGLRYIFGRTVKGVKSNEMIIILKVEIVDNIEDRKINAIEVEEQIKKSRSKNTEVDKLFEEKK